MVESTIRKLPIHSCAISWDEIVDLLQLVVKHTNAIYQKEASKASTSFPNDPNLQAHLAHLRDSYKVNMAIIWEDGETYMSMGDNDAHTKGNPPRSIGKVTDIYIDSRYPFQKKNANRDPESWINLHLDFSKPKLIDPFQSVSAPTINNSLLIVQGDDDAWVSAVTDNVRTVVSSSRSWFRDQIHKSFVYDVGLILFTLPIAIWVLEREYSFIRNAFPSVSAFTQVAIVLYSFALFVFGYRFIFGYAKWAFPKVEIKNVGASSQHRAVLLVIVLGVIGSLLATVFYEGIK